MKKALVVGSEGNVGKPLVSYLKKMKYDVLETDIRQGWRDGYMVADICNPIDLIPAFDWMPDIVFILSAMVSRVTCEQASGLAISTNLAGINNILQLCKRVNAMAVYFSTSEVYGPNCHIMDEECLELKPNNRYGLSKLLGEKLVEYEVNTYGLRAVTLRPFMIYDENEDWGEHRSAMIRFATNLAEGKAIEVHKGCARGWLHISDAVKAIERAAYAREYMAINIGNDELISIEDLAEAVRAELLASPSLLKFVEQPSLMTKVKRPKLDRQRDVLGIVPSITINDGIKLVCDKIKSLNKLNV